MSIDKHSAVYDYLYGLLLSFEYTPQLLTFKNLSL